MAALAESHYNHEGSHNNGRHDNHHNSDIHRDRNYNNDSAAVHVYGADTGTADHPEIEGATTLLVFSVVMMVIIMTTMTGLILPRVKPTRTDDTMIRVMKLKLKLDKPVAGTPAALRILDEASRSQAERPPHKNSNGNNTSKPVHNKMFVMCLQ